MATWLSAAQLHVVFGCCVIYLAPYATTCKYKMTRSFALITIAIVALVAIQSTLAQREPATLATCPMVMPKPEATVYELDHHECRAVFEELFNLGQNDDHSIYNTFLPNPVSRLEWANFTDVRLTSWDMKDCVVEHNKTENYYRIRANGIDLTLDGTCSYSWEPGMPVLDDTFKFTNKVKNATIVARLQRLPMYDEDELAQYYEQYNAYYEELYKLNHHRRHHHRHRHRHGRGNENGITTATATPTPPTFPEPINYQWKSIATTWINTLDFTTRDSKYTDFYNKLAREHNFEVRLVTSLVSNEQISAYLNTVCEHRDCFTLFDDIDAMLAHKHESDDDDEIEEEYTTDIFDGMGDCDEDNWEEYDDAECDQGGVNYNEDDSEDQTME